MTQQVASSVTESTGSPALIELSGVAKRYEVGPATVTALGGVDLKVDEGEFVVVLGPSGCGKTTLLNMIGALDTATEGSVIVGGQDISNASRGDLFAFRRRTVSFIFQSFNLFPGLTARENVEFGIDASGRRDRSEAASVLTDVGLGDRIDHFPHQLSGGGPPRVGGARAIVTEPVVLLADEPTGELDFRTGTQILELIRAEAGPGRAVLVVTHNREISRVADRVIELSSGSVVSDGPPAGGRVPISELHW